MKSFLLAFALVSAGVASVAGLSLGLPGGQGERVPGLTGRVAGGFPETKPAPEKRVSTEIAQAQTGEGAATEAENRASQPVVDESALRYFAARGDTARLNAEIARLKALYPTWTPPENPLAVPVNEDRQLEEMWSLYSQARYADVREAIARRQREEPQWTPPADLVERLDVAEKRAELVAAANAGRSEDVVRLGAATPSLLTCSDAAVLWYVAEALFKTDRVERAKDAYGYMLDNCTDESVRVATVQKASTLLGYDDMQDLLARERTGTDGTREFDGIRNDLARRFIAEATEDPAITVAPAYLTLVEKLAADEGLASDALLLGWYHLRRDDNAAAEPFFRKARAVEDSASASQGLALVLLARKMQAEAEEVMYPWRTSSDEAMETYLAATANLLALDPVPRLDATVLGRIAQVTLEEKHVTTGEQFGWYALAMNQPQTAEEWFSLVLTWQEDYEPAAYGTAVVRLRRGDSAGLAAIKRAWGERSQRIARLGDEDTAEDAVRVPGGKGARIARTEQRVPARERVEEVAVRQPRAVRTAQQVGRSANCRTTRDPRGLSPASALSLGWCLMDINRPLEAAQAFEVALSGGARTSSDAAYGQSLAYLRAGLTSDAAVAATRAKLDGGRGAELQAAILADRAVSSFRAKRYRETLVFLDQRNQVRAEPADLMVLRGYAYKNLGMRADAMRIFEAVGETGQQDAIRALAEMRNERDWR